MLSGFLSGGRPVRFCLDQGLHQVHPAAELGAGVAWVDEVMNRKGLGSWKRSSPLGELLFELSSFGFRVVGLRDLTAEGYGYATLDGQGAAFGGRPR